MYKLEYEITLRPVYSTEYPVNVAIGLHSERVYQI